MKEWKEEATAQVKADRAVKGYFQPLSVAWFEFTKYMGWSTKDVDEMPEDEALAQWAIYQLKVEFSIGLV